MSYCLGQELTFRLKEMQNIMKQPLRVSKRGFFILITNQTPAEKGEKAGRRQRAGPRLTCSDPPDRSMARASSLKPKERLIFCTKTPRLVAPRHTCTHAHTCSHALPFSVYLRNLRIRPLPLVQHLLCATCFCLLDLVYFLF